MITLVKKEQGCLFDAYVEKALIESDLVYEVAHENPYPSLSPPLLIVDGVPLDFDRAIKWIEGKVND